MTFIATMSWSERAGPASPWQSCPGQWWFGAPNSQCGIPGQQRCQVIGHGNLLATVTDNNERKKKKNQKKAKGIKKVKRKGIKEK